MKSLIEKLPKFYIEDREEGLTVITSDEPHLGDAFIKLDDIKEELIKFFDKEADHLSYEILLNFKTEREKHLFKIAIKQFRSKILGE